MIAVLKDREEMASARTVLRREGVDFARARPLGWYLSAIFRFRRIPPVPDDRKGWDVLNCSRTIVSEMGPEARILDVGCYNSEILRILLFKGYRDLWGIDLNPDVVHQPFADRIRYAVKDFYDTGFEKDSVDAVTCISAIEHGFRQEPFFREMGRIIRPGGLLLITTDYSAGMIEMDGKTLFGMPWKIFSREDIAALLSVAESAGFHSEPPNDLEQRESPIEYEGFSYTFLFLSLRQGVRR